MDPFRGFHYRLLNKRQDLDGVLGGLIPGGSIASPANQATTAAAAPQNTGNSSGLGGVVGGLTSLVSNVPSLILPSLGPSSITTSSTPLTHSSSSSTGLTTASASSVQTTTSVRSTTSTSPSAAPTPTATSTPSVSETVYTSSDGPSVVYVTSTLSASSATAAPHKSFSQDPSLEGGIFALVGIIALIVVFVAITWTIRKRRRNRLERDLAAAVAFDPGATEQYERQEEMIEKRRVSGGSSGHGHGYYGYGVQPAYAAPQEYHVPMGYGQYPAAAYNAPPPNSAPYRAPSPTIPQPAQGGANLTRKFSDRKPVPPLLPNPAYDPSNAHVSIPPHFYPQ